MNKFMKFMEEKMLPPMVKIGNERHLLAVRNGVVSSLSLILIGSFFLIFGNLQPLGINIPASFLPTLVIPFRMTMGLMAIYATFVMGYDLARSYKLDGVTGGVLSLGTFFMLQMPQNVDALLPKDKPQGFFLPMANLGAAGMFTGIVSMIFAVEVYRFFTTHKIMIKMPDQVPPAVARSFEALIPGTVILVVAWLLRAVIGFDLNKFLLDIFRPITQVMGNNLLGILLPMFLIHFLWSFGIHGMSIIGSLVRPLWLIMLDDNAKALAAGTSQAKLPYVAPEQFYQWTVTLGGAGATLSLCVLFLFCKSDYLKQMGRLAIVPGIFNINEPMIFGAPLILNPTLIIPFNLVPLVLTTISYFAVKLNLVNHFTTLQAWTLPAPIGAFLSAGNDWRVIVLVFINLIVAGLIYWPFVKTYDKQMLEQEQSGDNADAEAQPVNA